jgi:hypothetical protein
MDIKLIAKLLVVKTQAKLRLNNHEHRCRGHDEFLFPTSTNYR